MARVPYARHFGLSREAFALSPDPHFLWSSPEHAEALAALEVGLRTRRGLMVMVAEVGMGKTTVLHSLLARLGDDVRTAYLTNTRLPFDGLLRQALDDFGVEHHGTDRYSLVGALNGFLARCADDGTIPALVVDEAHDLDDETFENLRLLSNFDTFDTKLLQVVLVGQPELDDKLRRPELRQVAERVATRVNVNPFDRRASVAYLKHRLARAGGTIDVFTAPALAYLVQRARGVPRRLNVLCHNAMLSAWAQGAPRVGLACAIAAERERTGASLVRLSAPGGRRTRNAGLAAAAAVTAIGVSAFLWRPAHPPLVATAPPAASLVAGIVERTAPSEAIAEEPSSAPVPVAAAVALSAHGDDAVDPGTRDSTPRASDEDSTGVAAEPPPARSTRRARATTAAPTVPARREEAAGRVASRRAGRGVSEGETDRRRPKAAAPREAGRRSRPADGRRASAASFDARARACFTPPGAARGSRA